jgi:hypothetical protein
MNAMRTIAAACVAALLVPADAQATKLTDVFAASGFLDPGANTFDQVTDFLNAWDAGQQMPDQWTDDAAPPQAEDMTIGSQCLSHQACTACADGAADRANRAFEVLVNNERLLSRTLSKVKILHTLAEGAAAQHPAGKAAYALQQIRDIEPAKRTFFENLGKAQGKALETMRASLNVIGTCEQQHLGATTFLAVAEHTYQIAKIRFALSLKGEAQ